MTAYRCICKRADALDVIGGNGGVCVTCRDPEAMLERISQMPEPMRSVFLRVGQDFGVVDRDDG